MGREIAPRAAQTGKANMFVVVVEQDAAFMHTQADGETWRG